MGIGQKELPAGWKWVKLGDICTVKGGKRLPKGSTFSEVKTSYPYIRVSDFDDGGIDIDGVRYISREIQQSIARYTINSEDVYISIAGTIGLVGRVPRELDGANLTENAAKLVIISDHTLTADFLMSYLKSQVAMEHIEFRTNVVGQPKLALERIRTIPIPLPPLEEQKRIAAILNEQMAAVEKAKKAAEERLEAANALPAAYLRDVFEGEEAKDWSERLLGDVVVNHDGKRKPVKQSERKNMMGKYPYYGASGIIDYVNDYLYEGEHLLLSEDGANLLMRSTDIAFLASGQFWVNNHAHVLTAKPPFTNQLLAHALENIDLSPYISGSAQPKLSQQSMNKIPLRLPNDRDQVNQLVRYLLDRKAMSDLVEESIQQELDTIEAMPSALLRKAFSGEL
jgi:type I restriction enzyme S subunit